MVRRNGGFIGSDGLDAPDPVTGITPTAGNASLSIAFTAPSDVGSSSITGFVAQVSTDGTAYSAGSGTGSSSPVTVSSLTNGTAYTAKVWAINSHGTSAPSDASSSVSPLAPTRGLFGGGSRAGGNPTEVIQYYQINSGGENAQDFGDLATTNNANNMAVSSSTRAVFIGGTNGGSTHNDKMNYVTIASTGNSTEFGQLSERTNDQGSGRGALDGAGCGNQTRGVMARGAHRGSGETEDIIYITIASAGGDTDFGDLSERVQYAGALSSTTRGIYYRNTGNIQTEYITISSTGNATNFGLIGISGGGGAAGASSNTRGLFATGNSTSIRYCTKVKGYTTFN